MIHNLNPDAFLQRPTRRGKGRPTPARDRVPSVHDVQGATKEEKERWMRDRQKARVPQLPMIRMCSVSRPALEAAAQRHQVTIEQLRSPDECRTVNALRARGDVALALRLQGWSTPRIAKVLGYRNHTSVLYLLKMRERWSA